MSMDVSNIASHLPRMAAQQPDTPAVVVPHTQQHYSYRELNEVSDQLARGLQELGIGVGTRTVLMVKPGLDFYALVFALFKVGAVLVAVDPGIGVKNLGVCLAEAEPEAFIGIARAHWARRLLGWARGSVRRCVVTDGGLMSAWISGLGMTSLHKLMRLGSRSNLPAFNPTTPEQMAAILFTSGSTGVPKGVVYSHANFTAQVEALIKLFGIKAGEVDLATFPLFGLFAPAMGMTSVVPEMDFTRPGHVDPASLINTIQQQSVTTMFGSPALLKRVAGWAIEQGVSLPGLRRVISAGAPVSASIMQDFSSLLNPDVQIFTPYGATESLPVSCIGSHQILNETRSATDLGWGVCVGLPVAGLELHIIRITDEAIDAWQNAQLLPAGQIGEIVVRGPQVTAGYYRRDDSTRLAKITCEDGFYHRMGDVGYVDEEGLLWFCGRKAHRVETATEVLFSIPCEAVFNVHPHVFRSALVGAQYEGQVIPLICVELEDESASIDWHHLEVELLEIAQQHVHTRKIKDFLLHPGFPVDIRHNAKIGREKLAEWATGKLA